MPEGIRYQTCCERKEEAEQQLKETLSAHQRELFEKFLTAQVSVRSIEDEETLQTGSIAWSQDNGGSVCGRINGG